LKLLDDRVQLLTERVKATEQYLHRTIIAAATGISTYVPPGK
jgi:hypothetical protein